MKTRILSVFGAVFAIVLSAPADDCYEFTQESDNCVQLWDEDCGGSCSPNGNNEYSCDDPNQNWFVRQMATGSWDGVQVAQEGYVATSIEPITCGLIGPCSCGDFLLNDGIPDTCYLNQDDVEPYFDEQVTIDINRPCPETYPGGGGYY